MSIKHDWWNKYSKWVQMSCTVLSLILAFVPIISNLSKEGYVSVGIIGFISILILLFAYSLYRDFRNNIKHLRMRYRKGMNDKDNEIMELKNQISLLELRSKYADAYKIINEGFYPIHAFRRMTLSMEESFWNNIDEKESERIINCIKNNLTKVCDNLSIVFSKIYNNQIGACIKLIVSDNGRPRTITLVRDGYSSGQANRPSAKTDDERNIMHWLHSNSDFSFIYGQIMQNEYQYSTRNYFLSRNLIVDTLEKHYTNSRLPNNWNKNTDWPLPYKSTLVVPIIPLSEDKGKKPEIKGFICIDSANENCFNDDLDLDILRGMADGIYNQVKILHSLTI